MAIEEKNAVIESVTLTDCDRGILSAYLNLKYSSSSCQAFGGIALYLPKNFNHHQLLSHAGHFIWRCMEIGGVSKWEDLPGKTIRVRAEMSQVHAIGHIINDDWFCPAEDFKKND